MKSSKKILEMLNKEKITKEGSLTRLEAIFENIVLILSICLVIALYWRWFLPGVITWGDLWHASRGVLAEGSLISWYSSSLGSYNVAMLPVLMVIDFMGFVYRMSHWEPAIIERLFIYGGIVFFLIFSPWFLGRTLGYGKVGVAVTILVFNLNSFIFGVSGLSTFAFAIALCPLVLAIFIRLIYHQRLREGLLLAIVASLQMIYEVRFSYITIFFCILYLLYYLVNEFSGGHYNHSKLIKILLVTAFILFLLQSYWIIPVVFSEVMGRLSNVVQFSLPVVSSPGTVRALSYWNLLHILGLQIPSWGLAGVVNPPHPQFLFLPVLVFSVFLFPAIYRKKQILLFFGLSALIFCFLGKGSKPPFGGIYIWLYLHFPGFFMFREPGKWWPPLIVSYAVLVGALADCFVTEDSIRRLFMQLKKHWDISRSSFKVILITAAITAFFIIFPAQPISTFVHSYYSGMWSPRKIPEESVNIETFLQSQKDFFRVIWLPYIYRFGYYSNQHPPVMGYSLGQEMFSSLSTGDPRFYAVYFSYLKKPSITKMFRLLCVKYIIVPFAPLDEYCIYPWFGHPPEYYHRLVGNIPQIKAVGFAGKSKIYALPNPLPHFHTGSKNIFFNGRFNDVLPLIINSNFLNQNPVLIIAEQNNKLLSSILSANSILLQDSNLDDLAIELTESIKIPFSIAEHQDIQRLKVQIDKTGTFELWIDCSQIDLAKREFPFSITMDRRAMWDSRQIFTMTSGQGLRKWLKLAEITFKHGQHIIEIKANKKIAKLPVASRLILEEGASREATKKNIQQRIGVSGAGVSYIFTRSGEFNLN